ncbi:hypothetical protein [Actinokineospora inagensis]|uniref:hypothetical protein n=1 Tax=Actinokineospora inagensis TaxID=103730 RepID=UPI00042A03AB|nr:hypothetical protein [Actinokineospora inagensis]
MFRFSTLAVALLMASPSLYSAFVTGKVEPTDALIRFLIAVPIAAILLSIPRAAYLRYRRPVRTLDDTELTPNPTVVRAVRTDRA